MSDRYPKKKLMKNKFYLLFAGFKKNLRNERTQTTPMKSYIIQRRTLRKIPEENW